MISDPVESIIADALEACGIGYYHEHDAPNGKRLDFYIPHLNCYIECKAFPTPRTEKQLEGVPNVILIEGAHAACAFASILRYVRFQAQGQVYAETILNAFGPAVLCGDAPELRGGDVHSGGVPETDR